MSDDGDSDYEFNEFKPITQKALVCQGAFRDPLTRVYSYLSGYRPVMRLRAACNFMQQCFDHAGYLEGELCCPFLVIQLEDTGGMTHSHRCVPLTFSKIQTGSLSVDLIRDHIRRTAAISRRGNLREGAQTNVAVAHHLHFKDDASQIQELDRRSLGQMRQENSTFQYRQHLTVGRFPRLRVLRDSVLAQCDTVLEVTFEDLPALEVIGSALMSYSDSIQKATLRRLPKLTGIESMCMSQSRNLKVVALEFLPSLKQIGDSFLAGCGLEELRLVELTSLESIGDRCLHACPNLQEVVFEQLPSLETVGNLWMQGCRALDRVQVVDLPRLLNIGASFLSGCSLLKHVEVARLPYLGTLGNSCLTQIKGKFTLKLHHLPHLTTIGPMFLYGEYPVDIHVGEQCHPKLVSLCEDRMKPVDQNALWDDDDDAEVPNARPDSTFWDEEV